MLHGHITVLAIRKWDVVAGRYDYAFDNAVIVTQDAGMANAIEQQMQDVADQYGDLVERQETWIQ